MLEDQVLSNTDASEETRIVVENILRYHPNPFHAISKERFYTTVDEILARKEDAPIALHFFDLSRIASLIFDTHTQVHVTKETSGFYTSFPLRFKIFPAGLYIIAGDENYREAIGKRIVSISGQNPDDLLNQLSQHSSSDNSLRKRVFAETFLHMPETYDVFNVKTASGKIEVELENSDGQTSRIELSETWKRGYADFSWDRLNPFIPKGLQTVHEVLGTEVPFYLQRIDDNYWYQFLDDQHKYMYIQINKQFDREDKLSIEFHLEWTKALWESKAENIIIDLRNDPGGMTNVGSGLPSFLENMFFTQPDIKGIAVLFGLDTVSAGTMLIAQLEEFVAPVMIGEPTGSSPNMYLNAHKVKLPYSKLQFEVSQNMYVSMHAADPRAYIEPDIPMALTFEDYANGRDPLLEKAKTITRQQMDEFYKESTYRAPWTRSSQNRYVTRVSGALEP